MLSMNISKLIQSQKRLSSLNTGSSSNLNNKQTNELTEHLEKNTYDKVEQICQYVQSKYGIRYSTSGMTKWLHKNGFSYKKPKGAPYKANKAKQEEFIEEYIKFVSELPKDEVIEFADGVHPTMATKITSGWIKKGMDKLISTTASRTRVNLFGSINLLIEFHMDRSLGVKKVKAEPSLPALPVRPIR